MTRTLLTLPAAALSLAVMTPAHAASAERDLEQLTTRADANRDGDISWSEVVEMRAQIITRLDRNQDGFVDSGDRPVLMAGRFDDAFARLKNQFDVNHDRRVSRAEMLDSSSPSFESGDVNSDRVLSHDEIAALRARGSAN